MEKRKLESQLELTKSESIRLKERFQRSNKKFVTLEIEHESQVKKNRVKEEVIEKLKRRADNLDERLTMLGFETDEMKSKGQTELTRMKEQLKETEEELIVLKHKRDTMVKENMLKPKKNRGIHKSVIFFKKTQNEHLKEKRKSTEKYVYDVLATEPDEGGNEENKGGWWSKRLSFIGGNKTTKGLRSVKKRPTMFSLKRSEDKEEREIERKGRSRTDWFINVIGSLDKKFKGIKNGVSKNE